MTALVLALLVSAAPSAAHARHLTVAEYQAGLDEIHGVLEQGDGARASVLAGVLLRQEVEWNGETLVPDPRVLRAIANGDAERVRPALEELRAALATTGTVAPPPPAEDRRALEELARQQSRTPRMGGALPGMPEVDLPWRERVGHWLSAAVEWVGTKLRALARWLASWWKPTRLPAGSSPTVGGAAAPALFLVGGVAVLLLALALYGLGRRGDPDPERPQAPPPPAADADPTSRDEPAWRTHADALAAQGHHREAIRAWYHALLVGCFRAGVLRPRRGTTNREYARALRRDVSWAGEFEELTARFDLEWYGRETSTALAFQEFARAAEALLSQVGRAEAA